MFFSKINFVKNILSGGFRLVNKKIHVYFLQNAKKLQKQRITQWNYV